MAAVTEAAVLALALAEVTVLVARDCLKVITGFVGVAAMMKIGLKMVTGASEEV